MKSNSILRILFLGTLCIFPVVSEAELKIDKDSPLIPAGLALESGDSFHLVFVTSTGSNMSSLEATYGAPRTMATFNAYVNDVAGASTTAGISNVAWYVIGSTSDIDAKDNAVISAPVYRLGDGAKVADDAADMWDGSIDNLIFYDENGNDLSSASGWQVWSGTATNGVEMTGDKGLDLNPTSYAAGWGKQIDTPAEADNWIDLAVIDTGDTRVYRFYALSEKLTIRGPKGTVLIVR